MVNRMNEYPDLSGFMIYCLLLNKEAKQLGIISEEDYERFIKNSIEVLASYRYDISKVNCCASIDGEQHG